MNKTNLYHNIELPGITIPGNLFLAPMAGWTDKAFRQICSDFGADMCFSEMISATALFRNNEKTMDLAERAENETLLALQLFGSQTEDVYDAVKKVAVLKPALIDFNCGCPVPKIIKTGAGSALMKEPAQIGRIVSTMKQALADIGLNIPVSVKLRSGWDHHSINFLKAAEEAQKAGVDMIGLHARTRSMGYSGTADYSHIAELVKNSNVPIIGSGDLFSEEDAYRMLSETGCSGVMFARGAEGNPFIFERTKFFLENGEKAEPLSDRKKMEAAFKHLEYAAHYYGEDKGCRDMRKHICAYTKGVKGGSVLRQKTVKASTIAEYRELFEDFFKDLEN